MSKDKGKDEDEGAVNPSPEDTLRVMIATDNHLGYMEKDPIRGNDSFVTFEEILQQARRHKVDFLLLGGDLFHENKPSRSCMYKTMELLRKYCFGDRAVQFHLLSDPKVNFANRFGTVNYEDPNFNIDLPIFSIHGNHDDPAGDGGLAALDLLSVVNFVNYFGKNDNIDDVTLKPILIQKGITKLALYGMGNIRDERLYRTFQQKKVKLLRPSEDRDSWFNLFVLHQNRVAHSPKNYVHEEMIDSFLDFILWGHEHECIITPQQSAIGDFFISQPGSSVATSLSEGEAKPKYIGIMQIYRDQFQLQPIPLTTVRPFIIDDIVLSEQPDLKPENSNLVNEFLVAKVEAMIKQSEETSKSKEPLKPLIRLRVDYTGFSSINPARFGQRFVGRVANPNEILHFTRKRPKTEGGRITKTVINGDDMMQDLKPDPLDETSIEDLVKKCFRQTSTKMEILPEYDLNIALHNFVEKDDKHAIADLVSKSLSKVQQLLIKEDPSNFKSLDDVHLLLSKHILNNPPPDYKDEMDLKSEDDGDGLSSSVSSSISSQTVSPTGRGKRGSTSSRGARGGAKAGGRGGRGGGRGGRSKVEEEEEADAAEDEDEGGRGDEDEDDYLLDPSDPANRSHFEEKRRRTSNGPSRSSASSPSADVSTKSTPSSTTTARKRTSASAMFSSPSPLAARGGRGRTSSSTSSSSSSLKKNEVVEIDDDDDNNDAMVVYSSPSSSSSRSTSKRPSPAKTTAKKRREEEEEEGEDGDDNDGMTGGVSQSQSSQAPKRRRTGGNLLSPTPTATSSSSSSSRKKSTSPTSTPTITKTSTRGVVFDVPSSEAVQAATIASLSSSGRTKSWGGRKK